MGTTSGVAPDKNAMYDTATSAIWQLAVYEPVHKGREFTNVAGVELLDHVAGKARLGPADEVLELCSGAGAVARYLNGSYGCAVTGVEINEFQLAHARERGGERLRFLHGDAQTWQPDRAYDLALAVDSLSLLADPLAALRTARQAVRPGGLVAIADTVAGPELVPRVRDRAFELDGLRPLPGRSATVSMLHAAGFDDVHLVDLTDLAVDCFARISLALRDRFREISAVTTSAELDDWNRSTAFYLQNFRTRQLTYWRGTARRPLHQGSFK